MRVTRNVLLVLTLLSLFGCPNKTVFAQTKNYAEITSDSKFIQALDLMDGTSAQWAKKAILGDNMSHKPIKILFKDLGKISQSYATFDALGWKTGDQLSIFISKRHKNSPPEAIASILSHESIHQDEFSSIEEETYGWCYEAVVWNEMKKKNTQLINYSYGEDSLIDRLNTLEKMLVNSKGTNKEIKNAVSTNPGYNGLPAFSPGFDGKQGIKY